MSAASVGASSSELTSIRRRMRVMVASPAFGSFFTHWTLP